MIDMMGKLKWLKWSEVKVGVIIVDVEAKVIRFSYLV